MAVSPMATAAASGSSALTGKDGGSPSHDAASKQSSRYPLQPQPASQHHGSSGSRTNDRQCSADYMRPLVRRAVGLSGF